MSNKVLHIAKNDYEGVASAILCKYIFGEDADFAFYNYNAPVSAFSKNSHKYDLVIAVGLKNSNQISAFNLIQENSFLNIYNSYKKFFPEDFNTKNRSLEVLYKHSVAYIDWSWNKKGLYYGKNIDDLCKHLGREEVVNLIAERISKNTDIITNSEKEMLIFYKKLMTNAINNKKYVINTINDKKYAITYADNYEIELSNKILSQEKDISAVVIINMDTKIARIKTNKGISLEKEIASAGGITNSNGGTLKFGDTFDKTIFSMLLNKL